MPSNSLNETERPSRASGRRVRRPAPWSAVLGILFVTCIGMLAAIYWVVHTGKI